MFRLAFGLVALFASAHSYSVRIVNGTDAAEGEFPFAVSLRVNDGFTCGGSIINENHILTAAHCVCDDNQPRPAADYSVQYGVTRITTDDTNIIQVTNIACNDFSYELAIYDSAVLTLASPLPADNPNWARVTLASAYDTTLESAGTIIGWGLLSEDGALPTNLQRLSVEVYDDDICGANFNVFHHICFGGFGGSCNGDSGGALIAASGQQIGIGSFITNTCGLATPETPNVYARVSSYYNWIRGAAGGDIN